MYVELQVTSNYSFLEGASHPAELVEAAAGLGHMAAAISDRNSLAGGVRAHVAAKAAGLPLLVGARLDLVDGPSTLCYPTDRAAYGRLSRVITRGRRRAAKGACELHWTELLAHAEGQLFLLLPPEAPTDEAAEWDAFTRHLRFVARRCRERVYLAAHHGHRGDDRARLQALAALAAECGTPLVATNAVLYHEPQRRRLQDLLVCIREHVTIEQAGRRLQAHAERHLKSPAEMRRLFRGLEDAVDETVRLARRIRFSLDELRYDYPDQVTLPGLDAQQSLVQATGEGAVERYPEGVPSRVRAQIDHELALIGRLGYAPYFLTVWDLVRFARRRGILCQGRGSAANSAVCYCLGITAVDPARLDLLFERFVSAERNEPPDIDVDFEHDRREEVIQYIYRTYGRDHAGLTAVVTRYRARSAIRDVGKALGLSLDAVGALAAAAQGHSRQGLPEERVREAGFDPEEPRLALVLELAQQLIGFPRHLSQHVGGFVMTRGLLSELVPVENAAMEGRTVIQWDKEDLDDLGILKVDVLALGMLSCVRRAFELLRTHYGRTLDLARVPAEDPAVYDMLCRADTVGVFQVESRAQMSMLPRLKPRAFYDLVIEVAIVRPGPIQGDMVHPYLRRRNGEERVDYPSPELQAVLEKTLGVPLFQEQAMRIAMVAAGFSPGEADGLRRAMATFKHNGDIHRFGERFVGGMIARGYDTDFAERCFRQIEGFSTYGFPESHAASFALLVYVSAWLKRHYPAAFACALLNSQPMGFYAPAQILRDARDHGVELRAVEVNHSRWDHCLEPLPGGNGHALRLGFRQVKGLSRDSMDTLVAERERGGAFADILALWQRAALPVESLQRLAKADACRSLGLDRRAALWAVKALGRGPLPLFAAMGVPDLPAATGREPPVSLPTMTLGEEMVSDYDSLRLSLRTHPLTLLRTALGAEKIRPAAALADLEDGTSVSVAGLVVVRQRPGTAKGIIFISLEDETGTANVVVWPPVFERFRAILLRARLLRVDGPLQKEGAVIHVVAFRLTDLTDRLARLSPGGGPLPIASRDFH